MDSQHLQKMQGERKMNWTHYERFDESTPNKDEHQPGDGSTNSETVPCIPV